MRLLDHLPTFLGALSLEMKAEQEKQTEIANNLKCSEFFGGFFLLNCYSLDPEPEEV